MKNPIIISVLLLFCMIICSPAWAQIPPQAVSYQAVARDGSGSLLKNQAIDVQFTIRETSASGSDVYQETHATTTNDYGLFSLELGNGTPVTGTFISIDWSSDDHFLKVELDPGGGYVNMGVTQILSVPYALRSRFANKATNMNIQDLKNVEIPSPAAIGDVLKWDGSDFTPAVDDTSGLWAPNGNDISYTSGLVGIGTVVPDESLHVTGAIKIEEEIGSTDAPEKNVMYGNSMPVAYGNITFSGSIVTDYGIVSVSNPNTGEYDIVLEQSLASTPAVIVTCLNSSPNDEVATFSWSAATPNEIEVNIANGTGAAAGSQFSFVVFGPVQ